MQLPDPDRTLEPPNREATISPRILADLLRANDQLIHCILLRDRRQALALATASVRSLLNAESCGIFLRPDNKCEYLCLEAQNSEKDGSVVRERRTVHIRNAPKSGLTARGSKWDSLNHAQPSIQPRNSV